MNEFHAALRARLAPDAPKPTQVLADALRQIRPDAMQRIEEALAREMSRNAFNHQVRQSS